MSLTIAATISESRISDIENKIKIKDKEENEKNLKYLLRVIHHDISNALHIILNAGHIAKKRDPDNKLLDTMLSGYI